MEKGVRHKQNNIKNVNNYLGLTSNTFIGFDEPVFMVHHDPIMVFALGVVAKYDGNAFSLRRKDLRKAHYVMYVFNELVKFIK